MSSTVRRVFLYPVIGLLSCGKPAQSPQQCGAESRPQLDCASEFSYDATNYKGGFSVLSVGNADAQSETRALRQIDTETQQYIIQAKRLCDEYNKCVLDRSAYSERSESLRRRLAKLPELYDDIRQAKSGGGRAQAVSDAYRSIVPDGHRVDLALSFSASALPPGDATPHLVREGETLPTNTRVRFSLEVSRVAYVYLFQRNPQGQIATLFPDARIGVSNPVALNTRVDIPGEQASFRLNEKDIGTESVYVVASLERIPALEGAVARLTQGAENDAALTPLSQLVTDPAGASGCKSRALELDAPPASCVRSRGLELDNSDATSPSLRAQTEAADSTIVKVFSFRHVPGH